MDLTRGTTFTERFAITPGAPTLTVYRPRHYDHLVGNADVVYSGTAADDVAVVSVHYSLDGGPWELCNGTDAWWVKIDSSTTTMGNHTIEFRSYDGDRYSPTVLREYRRIELDESMINGPIIRFDIYVSIPVASNKLDINGTVTHWTEFSSQLRSEIEYVEYAVDDIGPDAEWKRADGTDRWTASVHANDLTDGRHTIHVRAYDGNITSDIISMEFSSKYDDPATQECNVLDIIWPITLLAMVVRTRPYWSRRLEEARKRLGKRGTG